MSEKTGKLLKITLTRSPIGYNKNQRVTVKSLGLRRMGHTITIGDGPQIRGMIAKVIHLVTFEEVEE